MMATKSQIEATRKYDRENTIVVTLRLNKKTDADIIKRLSTITESKMGYIKRLIRADM